MFIFVILILKYGIRLFRLICLISINGMIIEFNKNRVMYSLDILIKEFSFFFIINIVINRRDNMIMDMGVVLSKVIFM